MKVRSVGASGPTEVAREEYKREAGLMFEQAVAQVLARWEASGVLAPPAGDLVDVAIRNLDNLVAVPNELADRIGPFYDTNGVMHVLGDVSKQAIEDRRKRGKILAAKTSDRRWVYPTFQFIGDQVDPWLLPAIKALASVPDWSRALWFVTPNDDLGGDTPLHWVRVQRNGEDVAASARRTAAEWV